MHQTVREFIIRAVPRAANLKFEISDKVIASTVTPTLARYLMLFATSPTMRNRFTQIESWSPEDYRAYAEYLDEWPLIDYALFSIKAYRVYCGRYGSVAGLVTTTLQKLTENQATYFLVDLHTGGNDRQATQVKKYQATSQDIKYRTLNAAANPPLLHAVKALLTCTQKDGHSKGDTPLIISAKKGLPGATQVFLDQNFDVNTTDSVGRTALHYAAWGVGGCAPLHAAAMIGREALACLLVDRGADVTRIDGDGRTLLHAAAANGHEALARLLVERGAVISATDRAKWTPLHFAVKSGHGALARLLVERGANVTAKNYYWWTPLHVAAANGHETLAQLLMDRGADVAANNYVGWTPLHLAAKNGHETLARLLVDRGAKISAANKDGWTARQVAAAYGHKALARLLTDRGADATAVDAGLSIVRLDASPTGTYSPVFLDGVF